MADGCVIACPSCSGEVYVAASLVGRQFICPHCGRPLTLHEMPADEPPPVRRLDTDSVSYSPEPRQAFPAALVAAGIVGALVVGLGLLVVATALTEGERPASGRSAASGSPIVLEWGTNLCSAYNGNEAAADAKYLGKTVEFRISLWEARKNEHGEYYVTESTGHWRIVCFISPSSVSKLASKDQRDVLRLRGVCAGRRHTLSFFEDVVVVVKDCKLLEYSGRIDD